MKTCRVELLKTEIKDRNTGELMLEFFNCDKQIKKQGTKVKLKKSDVIFLDSDNKVIENYFFINNKNIENRYLALNKYQNIFNFTELHHSEKLKKLEKEIITKVNNEQINIREAYNNSLLYSPINFKAKINDKLVIGLGGHSVYETDITLHHIYGVPYIPASAIKGSFRNWIINKYFDKDEQKAMKNEDFAKIFGGFNKDDKSIQGQVIFMDSFPVDNYTIKSDVMTPHHSDYYTKEDVLPLDSDSVIPISFLVVTDTNFEFNIFVDKFIEDKIVDNFFELENETKLNEFIIDELVDMLNYQGLGGKTSAGYGYFDIKDDRKKQIKEAYYKKKEEIEKELKRLEEERIFREETKGMSQVEIELYKIEKIYDDKVRKENLMNYFSKIDDIELESEKIKLANYLKKYFEDNKEWKKSNKKRDKNNGRIDKICKILGIDIL